MSRHLKRVPLAFDWPLRETWGGYLNPHGERAARCPDCVHGFDRAGGRPDANAALFYAQWYGTAPFDPRAYGAEPISLRDPAIWDIARQNVSRAPDFYKTRGELQASEVFRRSVMAGLPHELRTLGPFPSFDREAAINREARRLYEECFAGHWCYHLVQADVDALIDGGRLWDLTHVPRDAGQALVVAVRRAFHGTNSWLPASNGHKPSAVEVNAWARRGRGHDGTNQGICVAARCAREGVPYACLRCEGSGWIWPSPEIKQQWEDWSPEDPPRGDGYQLWEDVSEGSPVSPVFATLDELCAWCETGATTAGDFRATKEEWRKMLDGGVVHAVVGNSIFM